MKEVWKPIAGYEGLYEVSNAGRVRSLDRDVKGKGKTGKDAVRKVKGRILINQKSSNGYVQVCLAKDGQNKIERVHRLVAAAFLENPLGLPEVNHKDENKTNNDVNNLEWCSHLYNQRYGNKPMRGERHPMRKLNATQIQEIRKRRSSGELLRVIARDFGISMSHACGITKGNYWQ